MNKFQYRIHNGTTLQANVQFFDTIKNRPDLITIEPGSSLTLSTVKADTDIIISQESPEGSVRELGLISVVTGIQSGELEMKIRNKSEPGDGDNTNEARGND